MEDKLDGACSTHLIDGDGNFNMSGIENFVKETKFDKCGVSYAVVAIMGPQSSGKSTLLNHMFHTKFDAMDESKGRSQTTQGIWIAKCVGIEPFTLVMDVEGSDGRERGSEHTAFERQNACFALAISDVVLINMWCHEVGRENASGKPLLRTMFEVVIKLFSQPNEKVVVSRRKTSLIFIIRDKTKTPFENLEKTLKEDVEKIWDSIPKTEVYAGTPLSEFFNVEVIAFSHYEYQKDFFLEEVKELRQRFFNSTKPDGLAGDRRGVVPASGFLFSAEQMWKVIRENKDLDLPSHKVMVANVRCDVIANEKLSSFEINEAWQKLKSTAKAEPVSGFGRILTSMLDACLLEYDEAAKYFDEDVRSLKREQLKDKLLAVVHPTYQFMLKHVYSRILNQFKEKFAGSLNAGDPFVKSAWDCKTKFMSQFDFEIYTDVQIDHGNLDVSDVRNELGQDMDAYVATVKADKLSILTHC